MGDPDGTITNWVINGSMPRAQRSIPDPFSDQLLPTSGQGKFIVTSESLHIFENNQLTANDICYDTVYSLFQRNSKNSQFQCHSINTKMSVTNGSWDSLTAFQYCSTPNVKIISIGKTDCQKNMDQLLTLLQAGLTIKTLVIFPHTSTIPQLLQRPSVMLQPRTITQPEISMIFIMIVILQTWLWRTFFSIWLTFFSLYHIWPHPQDLDKYAYIPDFVLGFFCSPPGRGILFVPLTSSCGILPSSYSTPVNYFIFFTRYDII